MTFDLGKIQHHILKILCDRKYHQVTYWVLFKEVSPHIGSDCLKERHFVFLVSILNCYFDRSLKRRQFSILQIQ